MLTKVYLLAMFTQGPLMRGFGPQGSQQGPAAWLETVARPVETGRSLRGLNVDLPGRQASDLGAPLPAHLEVGPSGHPGGELLRVPVSAARTDRHDLVDERDPSIEVGGVLVDVDPTVSPRYVHRRYEAVGKVEHERR